MAASRRSDQAKPATPRASLLIPAVLRTDTGGAARLELPTGTLRTALDALAAHHPRLERRIRDEVGEIRRYVNVYVDGEDVRRLAGQDTPIADRAEVEIIPSVAGG